MYLLKLGNSLKVGYSIDEELLDKYNKEHLDKKINFDTSMASIFADQEFINFLKKELDNGYILKKGNGVEIIQYDETKGHPILVELIDSCNIDVANIKPKILWSNKQGNPEYKSISYGDILEYDGKYIDSLKYNRENSENIKDMCIDRKKLAIVLANGRRKLGIDNNPENESILQKLYRNYSLAAINSEDEFYEKIEEIQRYYYGEKTKKDILLGENLYESKEKKQKEMQEHIKLIDPEKIFISYGKDINKYNKRDIKEIENTLNCKPDGGLWASEYVDIPYNHSEWENFCRLEHFNDEEYFSKAIKFNLGEDAKIFEINNLNDMIFLIKNYITEKDNVFTIDYEKLSKYIDGIEITDDGIKMLEENFNFDAGNGLWIFGFDVPSIVIFNKDVIENIENFDYKKENNVEEFQREYRKLLSQEIADALDMQDMELYDRYQRLLQEDIEKEKNDNKKEILQD